jgi:hypothetical protein
MKQTLLLTLLLTVSVACKSPNEAANLPPAVKSMPSAVPASGTDRSEKCMSIGIALSKTVAPAIAQGLPWPPSKDGDCEARDIDDLNQDGIKDLEVLCKIGMKDIAFELYQRLENGCLRSVGTTDGIWGRIDGRVGGFATLSSFPDDVPLEDSHEIIHEYNPKTMRYEIRAQESGKSATPTRRSGDH